MTQPRLLDRVREEMRLRHYSLRTEKTYSEWIKRFILFHDKLHPSAMGETEITTFLTWLATDRKVAASTQNQALAALLFLYKNVLGVELDWMDGIVRARRPVRVPVVLTKDEVRAVLSMMKGTNKLLAWLLYGTGMRVSEALQLRVLDIDFGYRQVVIRSGKGNKDRVTVLPESLVKPLQRQLEYARSLHDSDLAEGFGSVYLPFALERKFPNAHTEWRWQYVFPSGNRSADPVSGVIRRHHLHEKNLQRALRKAAFDTHIPAETRRCRTHRRVSKHADNGSHCSRASPLLQHEHDVMTIL